MTILHLSGSQEDYSDFGDPLTSLTGEENTAQMTPPASRVGVSGDTYVPSLDPMPAREGDASKLSRIHDPLTSTRTINQRRQFSLTQAAFEGDTAFSCQPTSPWSTAIGGMCSQAHGNDVKETNQVVPPPENPNTPAIDDDYVNDENYGEDIWMSSNHTQQENRMVPEPGLQPGLQTLTTVSSTYENLGTRPKTSVTLFF